MKKTSLIKGILLIILSVALIGTTAAYAASDLDAEIDAMQNFTDSQSNTTNNTRNTVNNTSNTTNTANNTSNTNSNRTNNTSNRTNSTTNSSVYNNTNNTSNLPKTGIEDSLPTMVLIVIFAISAVYAYKRIKDYNNI